MTATFTTRGDPTAEERVAADLGRIREVLEDALGDRIVALVLRGRFAAGEGLVIVEGQRAWALSDYVVVAVSHGPLAGELVDELEARLRAEVRVARVRLEAIERAQVPALEPSILAHEIKTRGHVFAGDEGVLSAVPSVDPAFIGPEEGRRLVYARLRDLVLCIEAAEFHEAIPPEVGLRISLGASEAVVAAATALLIENGEYRSGLVECRDRFRVRYAGWPVVTSLVDAAVRTVLTGEGVPGDPVRFWLGARRLTLAVIFRATSRAWLTPIHDWWDLMELYDRGLHFAVRRAMWFLLSRQRYRAWTREQRRVRTQILLLLVTLARSGRHAVAGDYLEAARGLYENLARAPAPEGWGPLREAVAALDEKGVAPR